MEAVEPLFWGFGSSPWFAVEDLPGVNQLSVEAPDDLLFNQLKPGKSYLGPQDQKGVIYTFYGIGGEENLIMSASAWDAIVITWIDALYRIATGDPLPWPVGPDLLRENEEVAMLMDLYDHLQARPQDLEQQRRFSLMGGADTLARYFWEETRSWASVQGREFVAELVGTVWWRFIRTVDLFVGQVIYALAGETEHNHHFYVRTSPKLSIKPEQPEINTGESILLEALVETHAGETLSYPEIVWEAEDGGNIDAAGKFRSAEDAQGNYEVRARLVVVGSGGNPEILEESVSVTVKEAKDDQRVIPEPVKAPQSALWICDTSGNLGKYDTATGDVEVIGRMSTTMTDIAFDAKGNLYGISSTRLYNIDPVTADTTLISNHGVPGANALVFGPNGTLYAAGSSSSLYEIDTATGKGFVLGNTGYSSSGDLAFNTGKLYLASGRGGSDILVKIDLNTYQGSEIGEIGFRNVYALDTFTDGFLYGISGTEIFLLNTDTGRGSLIASYDGQGLRRANGSSFY